MYKSNFKKPKYEQQLGLEPKSKLNPSSQTIAKPNVSGSVAVDDALAFAEYFRNNFDYCDCNASGRVYKWIDLSKRGQSAMTMKQIFDGWQSRSN